MPGRVTIGPQDIVIPYCLAVFSDESLLDLNGGADLQADGLLLHLVCDYRHSAILQALSLLLAAYHDAGDLRVAAQGVAEAQLRVLELPLRRLRLPL